ncbi:hypothetical protein SARC_11610 [Sphaeroforma arctica JP610]|uniref:Uncharacterized protein n=1 Tax=Sphaeroforma arctica JP610 TaxID=667725 RepID=A0A0L0FHB9_9EUKA|nr:hypothetical protein SARC_11610 [Sphaeroforma arctica JP610]KNC75871.1 hypothetical protein SARC_11610 [Sphaeroforma arctica JP610]|eukprot:XP_014149773.1 hypothetical protein SARC_11610 [Sphaeroforma arctica JP610]
MYLLHSATTHLPCVLPIVRSDVSLVPLFECSVARETFQPWPCHIVEDGDSEINEFWLRKTKKPVLSVLRYTKPGEESQYVYGMNIEVSMPTGSLCSERNAIGTAIASDPSLKRKDFDMIAILSISLPELANASTPAVTPNPARRDRRSTELDTNQTDTNQTQTSLTTEHGMLKGSKGSAHTLANVLSDVAQNAGPTTTDGTKSAATSKPPGSQPLMNAVPPRGFYEDCLAPLKRFNSDLQALTIGNEEFIWPQEKKRTELNPLDPCGSCMEWLRKIAEVNPDMKIVTFDSSSCERLYVKNVIR